MVRTIVKKNNYYDSINLMLVTDAIAQHLNLPKIQVMMGTDANKLILEQANLLDATGQSASANDMVIAYDADTNQDEAILAFLEDFLSNLAIKKQSQEATTYDNWEAIMQDHPDSNVALFSIPGIYVKDEIETALNYGLHVFSFTNDLPLADEKELKELAYQKGLMLMGADCGTGIINGVPFAFANAVGKGNIGIIGASGTGIQEVSTLIGRIGGGVYSAIGTGGRDLKEEIGAITTKQAISALEHNPAVEVIVLLSKPPAAHIKEELINLLLNSKKPVVTMFLGEKPTSHINNIYFATTFKETAEVAVALAAKTQRKITYQLPVAVKNAPKLQPHQRIVGLFSGGSLAYEAAFLISDAYHQPMEELADGYFINNPQAMVVDLGDEAYTVGKPHPMIDPSTRINFIKKHANDPQTGVILLDIVLGYGTHEDMVGALLPAISAAKHTASANGQTLHFVAGITGSNQDPQNYSVAKSNLEKAGVIVANSNAEAVLTALYLANKPYQFSNVPVAKQPVPSHLIPLPSVEIASLLTKQPHVVNVGLSSFNESILAWNGVSVQFDWKPKALGDVRMLALLKKLKAYEKELAVANQAVVEKLKKALPFLVDVKTAKDVISVLNEPIKTILHAGPPITWDEMTGPMQGSCIGAVLFEKWADNEADAIRLLSSGEVRFIPCHHVSAVGPMGGITSANMPVLEIVNKLDDTKAYCNLNEGIGKVLRFGAYAPEVITRLEWMRDVLGPVLSKALQNSFPEGVNMNVILAKSITMGDEFHQRNIAASLNFFKEISVALFNLSDVDRQQVQDVLTFLAKTDQFFLNIMMAIGKAMVDSARKDAKGTIVTTMSRNGKDFGIRIAELGDEWFTAPVNTPHGLYFTGFTAADANNDIGDSAITETVGVGGMAMIAAPGVTRFVGAGGFHDALQTSNEMERITIDHNNNFAIPTWDFKGSVLGIDAIKVVETGITPTITTGIAHKKAGVGQVGAGTVKAPYECFKKAVIAYAKTKGIEY